MAYLVLALGALLSIGGAFSIFQGAGIVQVERGWTGVIAGATSLTGGIITIALGLILKAILDLRAREARDLPAHLPLESEPATPNLPAVAAGATGVSSPAPDLESGLIAAFLAPKVEAEANPVRSVPIEHVEPVQPLAFEAQPHEPPPVLHEPVPQEQEQVAQRQIAAESPEQAKPRFKISFRNPAELPPEAPLPPVEDHPPVPAMDDWLDRAFSSLDNEAAASAVEPPRQPSARDAMAAASQAEVAAASLPHASHEYNAVAELEPSPAEPLVPHAPEPAPQLASAHATQSAVIGRYEADGTSYVMFADGSIEAQSEAGVYRFTSMTELKAFIEGTA